MNVFQLGWKNYKSLWTSEKYVCFKGRTSRRDFWATILIHALFCAAASILDIIIGLITCTEFSFISTLYVIATYLPLLALQSRRLHDVGRSAWWIVAEIIIDVVFVISLVCILITGVFYAFSDYLDYGYIASGLTGQLFLFIVLTLASVAISIVNFIFTLLKGVKGANIYGEDPYLNQNITIINPVNTSASDNVSQPTSTPTSTVDNPTSNVNSASEGQNSDAESNGDNYSI